MSASKKIVQTAQLQKINFSKINVDEEEQFRVGSLQISEDPGIIDKIERSIREDGLEHAITVSPNVDGTYDLVDGFHRHSAWGRLYRQEVNNNNNPWATIPVVVKTFANESEKRKFKFEANKHAHSICSQNTGGDIINYLVEEVTDNHPDSLFGSNVNIKCQVSCDVLQDELTDWADKELKGQFNALARKGIVHATLKHLGAKTTPDKIKNWLKSEALEEMKDHFKGIWDGNNSMDLSNDKLVLCGTVSSNEKHAKPSAALSKLIGELGTGNWSQVNIPQVKLVGYVLGAKTEKALDIRRCQMQADVKRMNQFCSNNLAALNGKNLIEYYELPQKVGIESQIKQVIF